MTQSANKAEYIGEPTRLLDFFELMKPRVMRLAIFTAIVGMVASQEPIHPIIMIAAVILIGLGAGASGALNMWWDSDIDSLMSRTDNRPIPSGRIKKEDALYFGIFLAFLSVSFLGLFTNYLAAFTLAFTILFYIVIYSMWLKRWTPQNIVIGGAAGAFPPLIGWTVCTGTIELESLLMFLIIFIWTPPHFWALSLFVNSDYGKAKVPMLTVTHGKAHTKFQILLYSIALVSVSLITAFTTLGGLFYLLASIILNTYFIYLAIRVYTQDDEDHSRGRVHYDKKLFLFSIFYLFTIFCFILIEAVIDIFNVNSINYNFSSVLF